MKELALVLAVTVLGTSAYAQDKDKDRAREAFHRATQHYALGEYEEALEKFKDAYRSFEDPAFLFDLAQCHRQLGEIQQALREYRMYLIKLADAPNQTVVLGLIAKLEKTLADEQSNKTAPPHWTAPPQGERAIKSAAVSQPSAPAPSSVPEAPSVDGTALDRSTPVYRKWWLWTAVGIAAVVAVGVGVGVGVARSGSTPTASTALGTFRF